MSDTVFTKVDYNLGSLVEFIALGQIGLPDIQRPFVWKNAKVRDLFDSMYKGYPVGYLLFWQNGLAAGERPIGTDLKQMPPQLVIVDGQQRLTSLYAVVKGVPVVRENFESERINIAFNPLEERFEVADAAIQRDSAFIPDISRLWSSETNLMKFARDYLARLKASREVSPEEEEKIEGAITKLYGLLSFPFTALQLSANISEEDVSDVFVRINSKGTPLNQADFILTLMSVFWDEGRKELEHFCRESRKPAKGEKSPFNYFIEPSPDQLLRVSVGVAFKRARLRYVYSILRGKDLETEKFSEERRVEQFEVLKKAQDRVLNLQYWHDFMNCLRQAGFRSGRMISSQNNLLFSYILYLMGRTEYGIGEFDLRRVIARWFFMSSLTGRFTDSPESAMEFDLARFRDVKEREQFIRILEQICDVTLTKDFWTVSLPNYLATSSPRSPSLFAYHAALVLLDAWALFSKVRVAELFDPALNAPRAGVERHHLFPKGYLKKLGLTSTRDTNQIANYALVEWGDNVRISDQAPREYLPELKARFGTDELSRMYHWHALPENWEHLDYREFLEKRRELIAQVISEGYQTLTAEPEKEAGLEELDLSRVVMNGESAFLEFKSALRTNLHTGNKDPRIELSVLKTLAGFLNTNGGTLIIGVADDGTPLGIEADGFTNEDKMSLHLVNLVNSRMGPQAMTSMHAHFEDYQDNRVMVVKCGKAPKAVFVKDGDIERFYIRTGPSTTELTASQTQDYIRQRFT
ncbi:MAG: DUF262 domain-containing protein [Deltaproteobacteria bacterium]|nr:DUF262 domain-containing protein [Desulfitobacteriaceae bacterium]MDI6854629.1 DUF262 domain-containing protein [Deltaproteobacteria bacterium]